MTQSKSAQLEAKPQSKSKKKLFRMGIGVTLLVAIVAYGLAIMKMESLKSDYLTEIEGKMLSRAKTLEISTSLWIASLHENAARFGAQPMIQLLASEISSIEGDVSSFAGQEMYAPDRRVSEDVAQITAPLPLVRDELRSFVDMTGAISGRVVDSKARTFVSTAGTPEPLNKLQSEALKNVLASGQPACVNARVTNAGIIMDVIVPIMPPRISSESDENTPVAATMFSHLISGKITELLSPDQRDDKRFSVGIVQRTDNMYEMLSPAVIEGFRKVSPLELDEDDTLTFGDGERYTLAGGGIPVYSIGIKVPQVNWWVVTEHPVSILKSYLAEQAVYVYGAATVGTILVSLFLALLWWIVVGSEQRHIATNFEKLYTVIEEQKRLIDSINSTLDVGITLADAFGIHKYANRAFAEAIGRDVNEVIGMDSAALFGFDTAKRLDGYSLQVLSTREEVTVMETLWLRSQKHHFRISKSPFNAEYGDTLSGVVTVYENITELVEAQERNKRMVQQTINALVRAIEAVDPYLSGHSNLMGELAVLIAKQFHLSEADESLLKTAASLSQIGKIFIPREILLKPGMLTEAEREAMQHNVEYAKEALKDIEFELPVVDTIYQMNERLDGKGYPKQLSGEAISLPARILAVANGFCAMARPRSYRAAMPLEKIMQIISKDSETGNYDPQVVKALNTAISTPAAQRLVGEQNT